MPDSLPDEITNYQPEPHDYAGEVLDRARVLVSGDRATQHGDKVACHRNIAALWSGFLGINLTAQQVALMLALMKIARTKIGGHNPDNYVDLAGYAGVAGEIAERVLDNA